MMHLSKILCSAFSTKAAVSESVVRDLVSLVGKGNVSTNRQILFNHGKDEGHFPSVPPDVVVFAENRDHVRAVAGYCDQHQLPLIPYGTGTGLEGGVNAMAGGVALDLMKMNQILEVNQADSDCRVQTGVNWRDLNTHLRDTGLWFPVDPGASASLGGMASTGASGTNAVRYGTMKNNVLNLEVVLPGGRILTTSGKNTRVRKTSAGYNLTELFVGSEGTLGIITELTLRLKASPQAIASAVCTFPDVGSAVNTAIEILQNDIPIARIEFMDELSMKACRAFSKVSLEEKPALFLEFHGPDQNHVEREIAAVREIASSHQGSAFQMATDQESRTKLWKARHELYYACLNLIPGSSAVVTDVCVPISKLTDMILGAQRLFQSANITGPIHGHVGDGNFHSCLVFDVADAGIKNKIKETAEQLGQLALSLGGTCTGEHGIGRGKVNILKEQFGPDAIAVMQSLKAAFDPHGIMNPGKLFL